MARGFNNLLFEGENQEQLNHWNHKPEFVLTVLMTFKGLVFSFTKLLPVIMNRRTPQKLLTMSYLWTRISKQKLNVIYSETIMHYVLLLFEVFVLYLKRK